MDLITHNNEKDERKDEKHDNKTYLNNKEWNYLNLELKLEENPQSWLKLLLLNNGGLN